jgi:hypothetical protein
MLETLASVLSSLVIVLNQLSAVVAQMPVVQAANNPIKEEVIELITNKAEVHGVNIPLALALADIESGYNPTAKNPSSTAKGLFQFIDKTWADLCVGEVFNPESNTDCAMSLIARGGLHHWTVSTTTREKLIERGVLASTTKP